jgi:Transposase DDE domain group 1
VKPKLRRQWERGKRKIVERLAPLMGGTEPTQPGRPEFSGPRPTYELASRTRAIGCGGVGAIHQLVCQLKLPEMIDAALCILKRARPYQDSDHVLNIAYNLLCGGRVLDDIEVRRNDSTFLDALGTRAIPDPTTAGDFCRRFDGAAVWRLMTIVNEARLRVWRQSTMGLLAETARIDADGSMVPTTGQCKQGMDLSYKGIWGYHPLLVSLANTGEPLFIVNRSGNRPSHEGAPAAFDKAIELCRRAGFSDILLRGDTDFSLTTELDRWDDAGVRFVFGYDANPTFVDRAENLHPGDYADLVRKAQNIFAEKRAKQPRVKEEIIRERGYLNKRLVAEDTAEFEHQPARAKKTYRIVVLRKFIEEERGQLSIDSNFRFFFYISNDRILTQDQVITEANGRCNQENIIEQLKNGARALHAPLNTLEANWAYMVIASLAWSIKAWCALLLPVAPRFRKLHQAEQIKLLRMDFRSFLQRFILIPAQVIHRSRRLIFRLLAWRPELPVLFRLLDAW